MGRADGPHDDWIEKEPKGLPPPAVPNPSGFQWAGEVRIPSGFALVVNEIVGAVVHDHEEAVIDECADSPRGQEDHPPGLVRDPKVE